MLLTASDWMKVSQKSVVSIKQPYILKYFLGQRSDENEKNIEKYAKKNNYKIIDITKHKECNIVGVGPVEFVYLFQNCERAFVDSFHGTVFSILFNKKFLAFNRPTENGFGNMNSRFNTLSEIFKIKDRFICEYTKLESVDKEIDYNLVNKILENKREEAEKFIKNAIGY